MKPITKKIGIVLQATPYKEEASLVNILTIDGIHNYILKGTQKPSSGTRKLALPLTLIKFSSTFTNSLNTITEGEVLESYFEIKNDFEQMLNAYPIIEKALTFANVIDDKKTFFNFIYVIFELMKKGYDSLFLLTVFEWKLIYNLGIAPDFSHCILCGEDIDDGCLDIMMGGMVCDKCFHLGENIINQKQSLMLKMIYYCKLVPFDEDVYHYVKSDLESLNQIIDFYYESHLDFISKAKKVNEKIKIIRN